MASIWITGAHGFIGKHLSYWLSQQGHRIVGLGHGAWPEGEASRWGVTAWLNGDIQSSNLQSLLNLHGVPDLIFHLAGGSSVGAALGSPREDFSRTVITTAELLEWMRLQAPGARLVAVSSAAVYGGAHAGPISEDARLVPYSPYGFHKLMMEDLCRSYAASYGLQVVVMRLFSVYGVWLKKQLLWDLCNKLSVGQGRVELGGSGKELRDWTDIRDVVRALELAGGFASPDAPVFNAGTGRATSVADIVSHVISAWGKPAEVIFSGKSRPGDPFSLVAQPALLAAAGFEWHVPVESGIGDYVGWYRNETRVAT
jgi:UDP-glucose 4-epimerase